MPPENDPLRRTVPPSALISPVNPSAEAVERSAPDFRTSEPQPESVPANAPPPFTVSAEYESIRTVPPPASEPASWPVPATFSVAPASTVTGDAAGTADPTSSVPRDCASTRTCAALSAEFQTRTSSMSHVQ